ncbi:hypothetical protein [Conservatibacter flavescens]|uniref:Uncharacterized protein n=1 Tax=Conservatibacter flavescens TaxID=28161 RepID=A0A2M8RZQ4_9PAST|nr:hypothetical protein [Conservatibacter flavescens]PJG84369.1 hypothetical protein CVP05_11720 [Conservatibacter flavescens]
MSEFILIILYNLLIAFLVAGCFHVWLKWQQKKRNDKKLAEMYADFLKFYDPVADRKFQKRMAEYDRKHPIKAIKRRVKEKLKWLL